MVFISGIALREMIRLEEKCESRSRKDAINSMNNFAYALNN